MTAGKESKRPATLGETVAWLSWFLTMFLAAGFLYYGFAGTIWSIALVPTAAFISTLIHEVGHAGAALAVGWRPIVVAVWPCAYHSPNGAFVVDANVSVEDGGGYVASVPGKLENNTRLRYGLIVVGGPLISLLAGCGLLMLPQLAPPHWFPAFWDPLGLPSNDWREQLETQGYVDLIVTEGMRFGGFHRQFVGVTGAIGVFCIDAFVRTAIPMTYRSGNTSDGRKLFEIFTRADPNQMAMVHWIATMLYYNVRLRDVPAWMYDAARAENSKAVSLPPIYDQWDIGRALDAENVDKTRARDLIEKFKQTNPASDWLSACDACLAAIHENDPVQTEAALTKLNGNGGVPELTLAALAAAAARNGETAIVAQKLDAMKSILSRNAFPNPTFADIRSQIESIAKAAAETTKPEQPVEKKLSTAT
jgi:hypothetical protein